MSELGDSWGLIRSIVHGTTYPTSGHWRELCALIDGLPRDQAEEAVHYVRGSLDAQRWPARLRLGTYWHDEKTSEQRPSFALTQTLHAHDLVGLEPLLEDLRLANLFLDASTDSDEFGALCAHPALAKLEYVSMRGYYDWNRPEKEPYTALEKAPFVSELKGLEVADVMSQNYQRLAKLVGQLEGLTRVAIPSLDGGRTERFGKHFSRNHRLEVLDLSASRDALAFFKSFRRHGHTTDLGVLDLRHFGGNSTGLHTVLEDSWRCNQFSSLHTLYLSNINVTKKVIGTLCESSISPHLRHIHLGECQLAKPSELFSALERTKMLDSLQTLALGDTGLKDAAVKALCSKTLPALEVLDLSYNALTHKSLPLLLDAEMPNLRSLDISGLDRITPEQITDFLTHALERWPQLDYIALDDCQHIWDKQAQQMLELTMPPHVYLDFERPSPGSRKKLRIYDYTPDLSQPAIP